MSINKILAVCFLCLFLLSGCGRGKTKTTSSDGTSTSGSGAYESSGTDTEYSSDTEASEPAGQIDTASYSDSITESQNAGRVGKEVTSGKSLESTKTVSSSPKNITSIGSTSSVSSSSAPSNSSTPSAPARECISRPDLATQLFNKINDYRVSKGAAKLTWTDRNATFAYNQAWANAYNDIPRKSIHSVDQIGSWGVVFNESEIVVDALDGWKASAGHNANMLDTVFNRAGVSIIEIRKHGQISEFVAIVDFDYVDMTHPDRGVETQ